MTRDGKIKGEIPTTSSPVRTRRHSGKQVEAEKVKTSILKTLWSAGQRKNIVCVLLYFVHFHWTE
jgi:hypothetical protein